MTQQQYTQLRQATSYYKGSEGDFTHHKPYIWQDDAACAFSDPEMFTIVDGESKRYQALKFNKAQSICSTCPVGGMCEEEASKGDLNYTVRNGKLPLRRYEKSRGRPPKNPLAVKPEKPKRTLKTGIKRGVLCSVGHDDWMQTYAKDENGERRGWHHCLPCKRQADRLNKVKARAKVVS